MQMQQQRLQTKEQMQKRQARKLIVERAQAEQDIARLREKAVNKEKFTAEERIAFSRRSW